MRNVECPRTPILSSLDNLHCMVLGISAKNCIRNPLTFALKSSVISRTANLPGYQGACLEDLFICAINKYLLNVSCEAGNR